MMNVVDPEHVAVVEDSDEDYAMYCRVFSPGGRLRRWPTGEAVLADLERGDPRLSDVVVFIVDLHLPGIDGCELVRRVRALAGGGGPVLCMLTTSDSAADRSRARQVGADGYLVKPDNVAGLRALPAQVADVVASR